MKSDTLLSRNSVALKPGSRCISDFSKFMESRNGLSWLVRRYSSLSAVKTMDSQERRKRFPIRYNVVSDVNRPMESGSDVSRLSPKERYSNEVS